MMQTTVAEYVALRSARALVLPTPASSNELHETLRLLLTVQVGEPVWTCVPVGAFAGLIVVVWAAQAAEAKRATSSIGKPPMIPILRILLIDSPVRCSSS